MNKHIGQRAGLDPGDLNVISSSATALLCDLEKIISPLCDSVFPSVKYGQLYLSPL